MNDPRHQKGWAYARAVAGHMKAQAAIARRIEAKKRIAELLTRRFRSKTGYPSRKIRAMRQQARNRYYRRRSDRARPMIGTLQGHAAYQDRLLRRARAKYVRRRGYYSLRY